VEVGKTISALDTPERLAGIAVEEPTISVDMMVNNSPFAGREGFVTGRQLRSGCTVRSNATWPCAWRTGIIRTPSRCRAAGAAPWNPDGDHAAGGVRVPVSRPRIIPREGPNGEQLSPMRSWIDGPEGYRASSWRTGAAAGDPARCEEPGPWHRTAALRRRHSRWATGRSSDDTAGTGRIIGSLIGPDGRAHHGPEPGVLVADRGVR
jgi:GTP-binding protein